MLLKNKNVIITGSAQGIGNEIATVFAEQGANIYLVDIKETIHQVAEEFKKEFSSGIFSSFQADVTNEEKLNELVEKAISLFGKIDILVNNAGIYQTKFFSEVSGDDWDQTMRINLKSMFLLSKNVVNHMIEKKSGCILNMSSVAGRSGREYGPHYAASKAAVISLTKSLAKTYGKYGIRTNALCPGIIKTEMIEKVISGRSEIENVDKDTIEQSYLKNIPLNRLGTARDVANSALLLCSDLASYINGQSLNVCGGYEMD